MIGVGGERVLVVEDEPAIQRVLAELLRRDNFDVRTLSAGRQVPDLLSSFDPQVVILDLGLPDVNGFDVLRGLRERSTVPVIVLSGRDAESDRVLALELGADDYVVKPFLNAELVARVRARLRRSVEPEPTSVIRPDSGLVIDTASREVTLSGEPVVLSAREFEVLVGFVQAPRRVFTREQLATVGRGDADATVAAGSVTELVHNLRRKVGADRIVTVRGVGYRFEPG